MTSLHWQTSLQTQKGHALTQLHWSMSTTLMYWRWLCYACFSSRRPYMVHRPTRVGTVGLCVAFERDSPGALGVFFIIFFPGRTLKQCRTHQGWLMFRWLALSDPTATDWDLAELISCSWRGCSLEEVWDTRVACSEDCMWSRHVLITF